jgi:hypothetical protein
MSVYGIPVIPTSPFDLPPYTQIRRMAMFRAALGLQKIGPSEDAVQELERTYSLGLPQHKLDQLWKESQIPEIRAISWLWRIAMFYTAQKILMGSADYERTMAMYPSQAQNFPYFRISMILDDCKRSPHAWLDGFAAKWDDEVWKVLKPPFGWECGCMVRMVGRPIMSPAFEPARPGMDRVPQDVLRAATGWMARNPRYLWDKSIVPKRAYVPPDRWPEDPDLLRPTEEERALLKHYGVSVGVEHSD